MSYLQQFERTVRWLDGEFHTGRIQADLSTGWGQLCTQVGAFPASSVVGWGAGGLTFRVSMWMACHFLRMCRISCRTPVVAPVAGAAAIGASSALATLVCSSMGRACAPSEFWLTSQLGDLLRQAKILAPIPTGVPPPLPVPAPVPPAKPTVSSWWWPFSPHASTVSLPPPPPPPTYHCHSALSWGMTQYQLRVDCMLGHSDTSATSLMFLCTRPFSLSLSLSLSLIPSLSYFPCFLQMVTCDFTHLSWH
jgi:hypothetical protein